MNTYEDLVKIKSIYVKKKKNGEVVDVVSAYEWGFEFMLKFDDDGADYSWYDESMELDFDRRNGIFACMFRRLWLPSDGWETLEEMMDDLGEEEINEFFDFDEIEFSKNTADFFSMDKLVWTKDEFFDYLFP